jgi:hypothetical protein
MNKNLQLMKKLFPIACLAIVVATLSSCTKKYYNANTNQTVLLPTVSASSWVQTSDGKADSVSIKTPALDDYFSNYGAVLVYFSYFKEVYEQIPEVYNNVAYSYIHYPGRLVIYAQVANSNTPYKPTDDVNIKLVLIDSNVN